MAARFLISVVSCLVIFSNVGAAQTPATSVALAQPEDGEPGQDDPLAAANKIAAEAERLQEQGATALAFQKFEEALATLGELAGQEELSSRSEEIKASIGRVHTAINEIRLERANRLLKAGSFNQAAKSYREVLVLGEAEVDKKQRKQAQNGIARVKKAQQEEAPGFWMSALGVVIDALKGTLTILFWLFWIVVAVLLFWLFGVLKRCFWLTKRRVISIVDFTAEESERAQMSEWLRHQVLTAANYYSGSSTPDGVLDAAVDLTWNPMMTVEFGYDGYGKSERSWMLKRPSDWGRSPSLPRTFGRRCGSFSGGSTNARSTGRCDWTVTPSCLRLIEISGAGRATRS